MISCKVLLLFIVINQVFCTEDIALVQHSYQSHESILCRTCGHDISKTKHTISKSSAKSLYSFYDKVFNNEDIFVQTFPANFYFNYPLIFASDSSCIGFGEWEESTWFPGYISRTCICPECGDFMGWVFLPSNIKLNRSDMFFGLILPKTIGETCNYNQLFGVFGLWVNGFLCPSPEILILLNWNIDSKLLYCVKNIKCGP